jgi:hypothetical protein
MSVNGSIYSDYSFLNKLDDISLSITTEAKGQSLES